MGILLNIQDLTKHYGSQHLFEHLSFSLDEGERVGLIGPNGVGKSTLLRILAGESQPDGGTLAARRGLRVGYLAQVPEFPEGIQVEAAVQGAGSDPHDWEFHGTVQEFLSKLSLDGSRGVGPQSLVAQLSGGWKKRVALARELAKRPDLLLLDEPTNHLDVESILWLEQFLAKANFAVLCVTHDRLFLQRIARRILEIDPRLPEGVLSVKGSYADYLETKEQLLAAQDQRRAVLQNTLRRETEWLRRGAQARSTKQRARIQRAGDLADELEEIQARRPQREVGLDFAAEGRRPKKLIEAKQVAKSLGGQNLFSNFSLTVSPGSCIALLGENGCGKSTLLRILLGLSTPDTGTVTLAPGLSFAFFEQNRESLDPERSLLKTLCPDGDHVHYRGQPVHIRSYLDRFLFRAPQAEMPVGRLSGGEQSRLRLAQLMLNPANVLVLDEPTNDLDIATLDLLKDCLLDFPGAVLLVTHDRYFLNQVATKILAFGPQGSSEAGRITTFASLEQWEAWHRDLMVPVAPPKAPPAAPKQTKKKLGYLEQREFDGMEAKIEGLEAQLAELQEASALPEVASDAVRLQELLTQMNALETEIAACYERWAQLEQKQ